MRYIGVICCCIAHNPQYLSQVKRRCPARSRDGDTTSTQGNTVIPIEESATRAIVHADGREHPRGTGCSPDADQRALQKKSRPCRPRHDKVGSYARYSSERSVCPGSISSISVIFWSQGRAPCDRSQIGLFFRHRSNFCPVPIEVFVWQTPHYAFRSSEIDLEKIHKHRHFLSITGFAAYFAQAFGRRASAFRKALLASCILPALQSSAPCSCTIN